MLKSIKSSLIFVLCAITVLALVACTAPASTPEVETIVQTVEVTRVVEGEVVTEVEEVEVTRVVETEVIVENDIRYGGTLLVGYSTEPTSFDPPKAWSTMDWGTAAQLLYNGVYIFNEENEIVPDLAADMPTVSEDGLIYTIPLKQGVLFHNGRELVAADVKYSLERNAKPDSGTWNATAPSPTSLVDRRLLMARRIRPKASASLTTIRWKWKSLNRTPISSPALRWSPTLLSPKKQSRNLAKISASTQSEPAHL